MRLGMFCRRNRYKSVVIRGSVYVARCGRCGFEFYLSSNQRELFLSGEKVLFLCDKCCGK